MRKESMLDQRRRGIVCLRVEDLFEIPLKGWNRKERRVKKNFKEREGKLTIITDIVFKMGSNTLAAQPVSF